MPDYVWWAVGVYLLLSYTIFWRLFVWVADFPKPNNEICRGICLSLWMVFPALLLLSPIAVPFLLLDYLGRWLEDIPIWIAFGGRKRDGRN